MSLEREAILKAFMAEGPEFSQKFSQVRQFLNILDKLESKEGYPKTGVSPAVWTQGTAPHSTTVYVGDKVPSGLSAMVHGACCKQIENLEKKITQLESELTAYRIFNGNDHDGL